MMRQRKKVWRDGKTASSPSCLLVFVCVTTGSDFCSEPFHGKMETMVLVSISAGACLMLAFLPWPLRAIGRKRSPMRYWEKQENQMTSSLSKGDMKIFAHVTL